MDLLIDDEFDLCLCVHFNCCLISMCGGKRSPKIVCFLCILVHVPCSFSRLVVYMFWMVMNADGF